MYRRVGNTSAPSRLMRLLLLSLCILDLKPATAAPSNQTKSVDDWEEMPVSSNEIIWAPCFENFQCTRLEVPLDWNDESVGTTKVAFIKFASQNESAEDLLLNFGGPGGSGVGNLLVLAPYLAEVYGSAVNLVSFDPRGVNNTPPSLDCFPGKPTTRNNFDSIYNRLVPDSSSESLATQFYMAEAWGNWCNEAIGGPNGTAKYVNTPAISRDMLTFIETQNAAKGRPREDANLWYAGYSYGTVLGATFASLYPDRVGRMILDGVVDGEDYYNGLWSNNLADTDAGVDSFINSCFAAGPDACVFYEKTTELIAMRLSKVFTKIKEAPLPVWNSSVTAMPLLATYADLEWVLFLALYFPLGSFPKLANILVDLEHGYGGSLIEARKLVLGCDGPQNLGYDVTAATYVIQCVDAAGRNNITSLGQYREYTDYLMRQSKYAGGTWSLNALSCRAMDVVPPPSGQFTGPLPPAANKTSFPLLFIGNTADPVTPLANAYKASSFFPDSVVLTLNAVGHSTIAATSNCTAKFTQEYLAGSLPAADITCEPNEVPFKSTLEGVAGVTEI